jgi:uncharacterized Fe-S cluster-containing radical SAM superfamily protein
MSATPLNTDAFSAALRKRGVDVGRRRLLITDFTGSEQEHDFTEPANCDGLGRIRHFRLDTAEGWPPNPLPNAPAARALGLLEVPRLLRAQVFQNAVCNWRCWYCYVDFPLLSGNLEHSRWMSAEELVELWQGEEDPPAVLDLSGGQPDLVPEWVPWMMEALEARGLHRRVYLWSDDNLSNDYFWTYLDANQRERTDRYAMYGKVCCFKGFDARSFAFNTRAAPELFARQFALMGRLLTETRIDLYAYATFTTPHPDGIETGMADFVDRLQHLDRNLPLRTVPLRIGLFAPVGARMRAEHQRAVELQEAAIAAWRAELQRRFTEVERAQSIIDVPLRRD